MSPSRADRRRDVRSSAEDVAPSSSGPRPSLIAVVGLTGLALGALAGGLLGSLEEPVRSASALLELQPDPPIASDLGASGEALSDAAAAGFLQTELVRLQSPGFADSVAAAVPGEDVELQVTQFQNAAVVQITAESTSPSGAEAVAAAATQVYADSRRAEVTEALDQQAQTVQAQLDEAQAALDALPATNPTAPVTSAVVRRDALQNRLGDLLTASGAIGAARAQSESVVTVVQEATLAPTAGLSPAVSGALVGGALGALLTAGGLVVWRRFSSTIGGGADLERYGIPVLAPEVPHRRLRPSELDDPVLQRTVAAQAPQLALDSGQVPGLVLMGPTAGVGTSYLALQHALYSARRGTTLLVRTSGPDDALVSEGLGVDLRAGDPSGLLAGGISPRTLRAHAQESAFPQLLVMTFGAGDARGVADLEAALERGLVQASQDAGWNVVIDAPPLDSSVAGLAAARHCGASVLIVAAGSTDRSEVERALNSAVAWGVDISALVVDHAPRRRSGPSALVPFSDRSSTRTADSSSAA